MKTADRSLVSYRGENQDPLAVRLSGDPFAVAGFSRTWQGDGVRTLDDPLPVIVVNPWPGAVHRCHS